MKKRTSYSIISVGVLSAIALASTPLVFGLERTDGKGGASGAVAKDPFVKVAGAGVGVGVGASPGAAVGGVVDDPFGPEAQRRAAEQAEIGLLEPVVLLEFIRTDLVTANRLVSEFGAVGDVSPLREKLEQLIDAGEAELVETCFQRTSNGLRTTTESVREHIYPTEFDPPEIPQHFDGQSTAPPVSSANPTAFDTRNVGTTIETETTIHYDHVSINLAPEIVRYLGENSIVPEGGAEQRVVTQPKFETAKLTTQERLPLGTTSLLGLLKAVDAEDQRLFAIMSIDTLKPGLAEPWDETPEEQAKMKRVVAHLEWISLDHREANRLLRKHWSQRDAGELRAILTGMMENGDARLIESSCIKARSGQRSKVESIHEHIYPTKWDPAEIPQRVKMDDVKITPTGANPTAFETRNVGTTVEIDPVIAGDLQQISVRLAPEIVRFLGNRELVEDLPSEVKNIKNPDFSVMRLSTQITAFNGQHNLVGSFSPQDVDGEAAGGQRVLLFVKIDVVK